MAATRFATPTTSTEDAINQLADRHEKNTAAAVTNVTATTRSMTAAEALAGLFINNVAGAMALTFPTAAALVAAILNCQVGSQVVLFLVNTATSGTLTLTTSAGNTMTGGHGTATMPTATSQVMIAKVTNATVGAEAVTWTPFLKTAS